ncbi:hypothetical protein SISNIDRAFT_498122 [Sistotremastrum niveocremeum HHB9708]|uniref:Uncharacterized protein n=1 Tax=Sistotremastrum niveocremeum HHB9708 TaxID=1314777 RepID=A0A164NVP2_9AGAM|nr:hypothetical protein SISNIDRAFT_498122 [Sistotremastrum niveocremeum HHB9708]
MMSNNKSSTYEREEDDETTPGRKKGKGKKTRNEGLTIAFNAPNRPAISYSPGTIAHHRIENGPRASRPLEIQQRGTALLVPSGGAIPKPSVYLPPSTAYYYTADVDHRRTGLKIGDHRIKMCPRRSLREHADDKNPVGKDYSPAKGFRPALLLVVRPRPRSFHATPHKQRSGPNIDLRQTAVESEAEEGEKTHKTWHGHAAKTQNSKLKAQAQTTHIAHSEGHSITQIKERKKNSKKTGLDVLEDEISHGRHA